MNKAVFLFLLLLLLAAGLWVANPASSNTDDVIIVNNADAMRQTAISANSELSSRLGQVVARLRVQYADALRRIDLPPVPAPLSSALGSVQPRIRLSYGDTLRRVNLLAPSQPLMSALGSVHERIRLSYADRSRQLTLSYPVDLVDDTSKPIISNVAGNATGLISWTTDEFATSTVRYGTSPGSYPSTVSSSLFVKQHQLQLTGIQSGVRYYFVVSSVDQSGNLATSGEHSLTQSYSLFLPNVLKAAP